MIIVVDCLMCLCNGISCWILVLRSIWLADCCFCDVFGRVVYPIGVPVLSFVLLSGFFRFSFFLSRIRFISFPKKKRRGEEGEEESSFLLKKKEGRNVVPYRLINCNQYIMMSSLGRAALDAAFNPMTRSEKDVAGRIQVCACG